MLKERERERERERDNELCLHNLPHRNAEYPADYSLKNSLAYKNTKCQNKI